MRTLIFIQQLCDQLLEKAALHLYTYTLTGFELYASVLQPTTCDAPVNGIYGPCVIAALFPACRLSCCLRIMSSEKFILIVLQLYHIIIC